MKRLSKLALVSVFALGLAACDSAEERAEKRYQSGLSLLAEGDTARAIIEFRNVFEFDENHKGARESIARAFLAQGNPQQAYRHFLRLAEQYPDDGPARVELARMAFKYQDWDEFNRHGAAAIELVSDDPETDAIELGLKYQEAVLEDSATDREGVAAEAAQLINTLPDSRILRNILIDIDVYNSNIDGALVHVDHLIALNPDELDLHEQRLALVAQKNDPDLIEEQLLTMIDTFPEVEEIQSTLLRLYGSTGNVEAAENFLREISDPTDEDPKNFLQLIRFVTEVHGPEAGRLEIERGIAEAPDNTPFRALRAGMDFTDGNTSEAIAEMESIVSTNEPSEQRHRIQIGLAQMMVSVGNEVGARRLVEEVLAEDGLQTEALLMQASWQIETDDSDGAILSLRTAVDVDPDNTRALELLARAYTRAGNHELARDSLSRAVETSGNAPEQSIRYATVLMEREQYLPAESVLIPALRLSPGNPDILAVLGRVYLLMDDQPRTTQVIDTLRRLDTDRTTQIANALRADQLRAQSGVGDAVAFLEQLSSDAGGGLDAQLLLLRGHLAAGNNDAAQNLIQQMIAENPGNARLPYALAAVKSATGDLSGAADDYRALLADTPNNPRVWLELSRVLARSGDAAASEKAIGDGLEASGDDPNLLWARASILETENRIEEAIGIYEALYARSSDSIIVANNLASLLSSYREDEESLERAFTVAKRFRDTEIPALQDTYGWILHRRGNTDEALPYLENAAAELTNDALTQYHLAVVYLALGDSEKAKVQFQRALDIAGPADTRPQIEDARAQLAQIGQQTVDQ